MSNDKTEHHLENFDVDNKSVTKECRKKREERRKAKQNFKLLVFSLPKFFMFSSAVRTLRYVVQRI